MVIGHAAKVVAKGRCWSMVHIFNKGRALCGYKPNKSMSIQWCADAEDWSVDRYVECEKCKNKWNV